MKILDRLFSRNKGKPDEEDVVGISRTIRPIVDEITLEIFSAHRDELVREEITYIVPAIWGAHKKTGLTPTQKEIHSRVAPAINEIIEKLRIEGLDSAQDFALGFLIRDLLITKIVYMTESYRNRLLERSDEAPDGSDDLRRIDPVGSA